MDLATGAGLVDERGLLKDWRPEKEVRDSRTSKTYRDAVTSVGGQQAASEWIAIGRGQTSCRTGGQNVEKTL